MLQKLTYVVCCAITLTAGILFSVQNNSSKNVADTNHGDHAAQMVANLERSVVGLDLPPLDFSKISLESTSDASLDKQLSGKWSLIFFGFTNCPHVCPMTLSIIDRAYRLPMSPLAEVDSQVVFISVDPEQDSLDKVRDYLQNFNESFIGYTGDQASITKVSKIIGADFDKTVTDFDHSTTLFLMDPDKRLHALILRASNPKRLLQDFNGARNSKKITQLSLL